MRLHLAIFAVLPLLCALPAAAQAPVTPGQVGDTLAVPVPPPAPAEAPVVEREQAPSAAPAADASAVKVTVRQFRFIGNSAYSTSELQTVVAPYLNRPLSFSELYAAADAITRFYVDQGYTLANVNIPPQKISDGEVKLEVIEGRIGAIQIEGLHSFKGERLRPYFSGVMPGQLYRGTVLQDALFLINDIPGLQAHAVVRPGQQFGTSDVVIRAQETPYTGFLALDNYGRESIGELRLSGAFTWNNPLGIEDQLQISGLVSEDALLGYGGIAYSLPVNAAGTRAELSYNHSRFKVDSSVPVDGNNDGARIGLSHPLLLSAADTWRISGGVSYDRSESDLAGLPATGTDITLLELGSLYIHRYPNAAVTQVNMQMASNFQRMTRAELNGAPPIDGKQMLRVQLDAQHLQPLLAGFNALLRGSAVYSPDPLVDTQQFSVGGPSSVRGYPAAEVRGDGGTFASITLQRPFFLNQVVLNPRVVAETGQVTRKDPNPGVTRSDSLASVGVGFDLNVSRYAFKLDWSYPTDEHTFAPGSEGQISNGDHGRIFGLLSASF